MKGNEKDKRYWFPAKKYGLGWGPPTTWEGWAVLAIATAGIVGSLLYFERPAENAEASFVIVFIVFLLGVICLLKGEPLNRK